MGYPSKDGNVSHGSRGNHTKGKRLEPIVPRPANYFNHLVRSGRQPLEALGIEGLRLGDDSIG